jgi:M6 family metalloprotease-like protein
MRPSVLSAPLLALCAGVAVLAGAGAATVEAQDVELLARIHGTTLPEGYFRTLAESPRAFQFATGRTLRLEERLREVEARLGPRGTGSELLLQSLYALGQREGAVVGNFKVPVLLGLFADSPPDQVPFPRDQVQTAYFGDGPGTITDFYREVSGNRVTLRGELRDWQRSAVTRAGATGGQSGLVSGTVGLFIMDLLRRVPADFDWGPYDNDGPDGIPNSGDDDGFVDALAVLHPTQGAECSGAADRPHRIWSHRWNLTHAAGEAFVTTTPRPNGGTIRVDDYVIQPVLACNGTSLNEIGVFTHELGHAFGLPDLYDTRSSGTHQGVGNWDLMGTGSWGCNGQSPSSPCHMGAWSKMVLGWADVEVLPADTDVGTLTLPGVVSSGKIYRANAADGSGEYYLLENRQRFGFDALLYNDGLLVWRVSQPLLEARWRGNRVNAGVPLGVWIREADGLNELATPGCGRGNAGDPFPFVGPFTGCQGKRVEGENRVFHAGSTPSSLSDAGTASGLTLTDVRKGAGVITFRASTRFTRVAVRSEGDGGAGGIFKVDGVARAETGFSFRSAPFRRFTVKAVAGETVAPGVRRPFSGWADAPQAPRVRVVDTPLSDLELVARYGGEEVELAVALEGGQGEIAPGTVEASPARPGLWFPRGSTVTVEAKPRRGFAFLRWGGALAGQSNPATLRVDGPTQATAVFELAFKVSAATVRLEAAADQLFTLEPENGTAPYQWKILDGRVPEGLNVNNLGHVTGAAMETGSFRLSVEVTDGIGLRVEGSFTLQVDDAVIPVSALASRFLGTGPPLTLAQARYLDRRGNNDGVYDLGDFRAWVLAHPGLPLTAPVRTLVGPSTVDIPPGRPDGPEARR